MLRISTLPKLAEGLFSDLRMNISGLLSSLTPKDFRDAVYRRYAFRAADYQLPREEVWFGIFQPFG